MSLTFEGFFWTKSKNSVRDFQKVSSLVFTKTQLICQNSVQKLKNPVFRNFDNMNIVTSVPKSLLCVVYSAVPNTSRSQINVALTTYHYIRILLHTLNSDFELINKGRPEAYLYSAQYSVECRKNGKSSGRGFF